MTHIPIKEQQVNYMDEYLSEVVRKVKEMLGEDVPVGSGDPLCSKLGLSSMQLARLAYELEETFGIEIPDAAFKSDMTALDFAGIIQKEIGNE